MPSGTLVYYASYPGEKVTISGGTPLDGLTWQKTELANSTVYKAINVTVANPKSFSLLVINGSRQIRARFPNGDPTVPNPSNWVHAKAGVPGPAPSGEQFPLSVTVVSESDEHNVLAQGSTGVGHPQITLKVPEKHRRPTRQNFFAYRGGTSERFNADFNHPFWNTNVDVGLSWNKENFTKHRWTKPQSGIVHMLQTHGWGGWMYNISAVDYEKQEILFASGGFQEARGGHIQHNAFYVENIKEEVDTEREWFYDADEKELYFIPKAGLDPNDKSLTFIASQLKTLISIEGNFTNPVRNIAFSGLTFSHTDITFLDDYEVPSGGMWSAY